MKRKYYIRGLGFGVLITSLVFIFLGQPKDISEEEIIRRAEALGYVKADTSADSDTEQNTTPSIDLDKLLNNMNSSTPAPTAGQVTETPLPTETPEPTSVPTEEPTVVPTPEPTVVPTPEPVTESTPVPTVAPSVTEQPDATLVPTESPATEITPEPTSAELPTLTATPAPTRVPSEVVTAEITVVAGVYSGEVCQLLEDAGIVEDGLDFRWYLAKNGFDREIMYGTYTLSSDMTYQELAKILTRTIHSNQNNQETLGSHETLDNQENLVNPDGQNTTDTPENLEISNGQNTSNN